MKQRGRNANRGMQKTRGHSHVNDTPMYTFDINFKAIGQKLRDERESMGWTQEEVAEIIGITPAFVGHIERAERSMSLNTLIHFCNLYRITIDYLLSETLPSWQDNTVLQMASIIRNKTAEQQAAILDMLRSITRHM